MTNWHGIAKMQIVNVRLSLDALTRPVGALGQPVLLPEVTPRDVQAMKNARVELDRAIEAAERELA